MLQFAGTVDAARLRAAWREVRQAGPVCALPWSEPEEICAGSERAGDPLCSPQNNSGVVADHDGVLWQFTAFYSVDEQFGGGRKGSYSRVAAFRRAAAGGWQPQGIVADPVPWNLTYAGDPFAFRDRDGTPCLAVSVVDGSDGFNDWSHIGLAIQRSSSRSFAGPWSAPRYLLRGLSGHTHRERAICWRLLPRPDGSWLALWNHGESDITWRGLVLPDLERELTHAEVLTAPILARNQDEGGGGFVDGDQAFLSTWQIPAINDPTAVQRLYRVDLAQPLAAESWRVIPGSVGWTDPTDPRQNGGPTADAWNLSLPQPGTMWATAVVWSVSEHRNRVLAWHCPWPSPGGPWRIGVPDRVWQSHGPHERVIPCLEWALGWRWSAELDLKVVRWGAGIWVGIVPGAAPPGERGMGLSLGPDTPAWRTLDAAINANRPASVTGCHRLKLDVDGDRLEARLDGRAIPGFTWSAAERAVFGGDLRLALGLGRGASIEVSRLVVTDSGA